MAHAACINGHGIWNGDGSSVVEAYRINYFRKIFAKGSECVIHHDFSGSYPYIYDCVDDVPGEELDIWYCEECGSFIVFDDLGKKRFDYIPWITQSVDAVINFSQWEEYVAIMGRSDEFEAFHEFCEGKNPLDALLSFGFRNRYYLSPDRKYVARTEAEKGITAVFKLARCIDFKKQADSKVNED